MKIGTLSLLDDDRVPATGERFQARLVPDERGVTASSGWCGQGLGQSRSRNSALKRAAQKGATHIVWSRMASGMGGGNASGRAYKCESAATGNR